MFGSENSILKVCKGEQIPIKAHQNWKSLSLPGVSHRMTIQTISCFLNDMPTWFQNQFSKSVSSIVPGHLRPEKHTGVVYQYTYPNSSLSSSCIALLFNFHKVFGRMTVEKRPQPFLEMFYFLFFAKSKNLWM